MSPVLSPSSTSFGTNSAPSDSGPAWFERMRERRRTKRLEKEARTQREVKRRVDDLLEKVHQDGLESLSGREKRFLKNASRKYRR